MSELWLIGVALLAAAGAFCHAIVSSRQTVKSKRTVADMFLAAWLATGYTKLHLIAGIVGISIPELPKLDDWPMTFRAFCTVALGYGIASFVPNLLDWARKKFGVSLPYPEPDVISIEKPKLTGTGDGMVDPAQALMMQTEATKVAVVKALDKNEEKQLETLNKDMAI